MPTEVGDTCGGHVLRKPQHLLDLLVRLAWLSRTIATRRPSDATGWEGFGE
jgi:uncharacterized heparinase superfamily protein